MLSKGFLIGTICFMISFFPSVVLPADGWLGVIISEFNRGSDEEHGIKILDVCAGGPAEQAGLQKGDIIIEFGDTRVRTIPELQKLAGKSGPGVQKNVVILRNGEERVILITMGEKKKGQELCKEKIWTAETPEGSHKKEYNIFVAGEPVTRGFLGVNLQDLEEQLREYFGAPGGQGVLIDGIVKNSPAERAGLRAGDIILAINGEDVDCSGMVQKIVRLMKEGDIAEVLVLRRGEKIVIPVSVGEKKVPAYFIGSKNEGWSDYVEDYIKKYSDNSEEREQALKEAQEVLKLKRDELIDAQRKAQEYLASDRFKKKLKEMNVQLEEENRELMKRIGMLERRMKDIEKKLSLELKELERELRDRRAEREDREKEERSREKD